LVQKIKPTGRGQVFILDKPGFENLPIENFPLKHVKKGPYLTEGRTFIPRESVAAQKQAGLPHRGRQR
jgi:hypothetical protein